MSDEKRDLPADFRKLIPELATYNNGEEIDVDSWLSVVGSYEHAIAYTRLFWPAFVIHDDCVLFADFSREIYEGSWTDSWGQTGSRDCDEPPAHSGFASGRRTGAIRGTDRASRPGHEGHVVLQIASRLSGQEYHRQFLEDEI
jgi:hypothetical protein